MCLPTLSFTCISFTSLCKLIYQQSSSIFSCKFSELVICTIYSYDHTIVISAISAYQRINCLFFHIFAHCVHTIIDHHQLQLSSLSSVYQRMNRLFLYNSCLVICGITMAFSNYFQVSSYFPIFLNFQCFLNLQCFLNVF